MVGECLRTLASDGYRYNSNSQASSGAAGSSSGDAPFVRITTKAHPSQPGGLSPSGLEAQLEASLKDLGVCKVCMRLVFVRMSTWRRELHMALQ